MPKSPGEMIAAVKANMSEKTGKTFEQWVEIAKAKGPSTAKECYAWLKKTYGVPHLSAQIIADKVGGHDRYSAYENPEALVDAMYAGPKEGLRPIYEQLVGLARKLGKDVKVTPCKTYVALRRKRQFGIVKPTTKTRVDLGLTLSDVQPRGRLEAASNVGSERISHVIKIESAKEIDAEVKQWLKQAYDQDAQRAQ
jgi:predicted transport protein